MVIFSDLRALGRWQIPKVRWLINVRIEINFNVIDFDMSAAWTSFSRLKCGERMAFFGSLRNFWFLDLVDKNGYTRYLRMKNIVITSGKNKEFTLVGVPYMHLCVQIFVKNNDRLVCLLWKRCTVILYLCKRFYDCSD